MQGPQDERRTPARSGPWRRMRQRLLLATLVACGLAHPVSSARADVAPARADGGDGARTFYQMTFASDLVVRARITDGDGTLALEEPTLRLPVVTATVLEALRGEAPPAGPLVFAQHGRDAVDYTEGEEVVLFLERIARVPELATTRVAAHVPWVSRQGDGEKVSLASPSGDALLGAIRAYAGLASLSGPAQLEGLRRLTVRLLQSRAPRLSASAARDVALAADVPLVTAADVPVLEPMIDDPRIAIATRIATLVELDRRRLVFGPPRWARLLRETRGSDRLAVVRAAGFHPSTVVTEELVAILASGDPELAAAAATSLGTPGNHVCVEPLARALGSDDARLRMAAIRALGRIGTLGARHVLELATTFHPDPATRRRTGAEVVLVARRQGTTLAPTLAAPGTGVAAARGQRSHADPARERSVP